MAENPIKQRLDDINAISIAIDTYDDIFSDFDPRDISQRDLSEDFIIELTRRHRQDMKGKYDVVLVAPRSIEDTAAEKKIISRLNRYFHQKYRRYVKSINELRLRGSIYIALGMAFLLALALLTYYKKLDILMLEIIGIVFMPLGWFGIWEGFSKIVDLPFKLESDTQVYKKLSRAAYKFEYIGEAKK
jgi:hypothetical protein